MNEESALKYYSHRKKEKKEKKKKHPGELDAHPDDLPTAKLIPLPAFHNARFFPFCLVSSHPPPPLSLFLFLSSFVVCDRSRDRFEYPSGSRLLFQTSLSTTIASSRRVNTIRVSA